MSDRPMVLSFGGFVNGVIGVRVPEETCEHRWTDWSFYMSASTSPDVLETRFCICCKGEEFRRIPEKASVEFPVRASSLTPPTGNTK